MFRLFRKGRKWTTTKVLSVRNLLFRLFPWKTKRTRVDAFDAKIEALDARDESISNESISEAATASAVCAMRAVNLSCCEFSFFILWLGCYINRLFWARWQSCTHIYSKMWKKNGDELNALSWGVGKKWSKTLFAHCERKTELEMFLLCTCPFSG